MVFFGHVPRRAVGLRAGVEVGHACVRMICRFKGSAAEVRLEGVGSPQLTKPAAFSAPFAARVELVGAHVGSAKVFVSLDPAGKLEPVELSWDARPYAVSYRAGPGLAVTIDAGGEAGHVQGVVPGMPSCLTAWCPLTWTPGQPKKVTVTPAPSAAGEIAVTGGFPFDEPSGPEATSKVTKVMALGAQGTLTCDTDAQSLKGATLSWQVESSGPIRVEPLVWAGGALTLAVTSERHPAGAPSTLPWFAGAVVATACALAFVAAWAVRRWLARRGAPLGSLTPQSAEPAAPNDASGVPPAGPAVPVDVSGALLVGPTQVTPLTPIELFYSYADADAPLLKELERHLQPLMHGGRVCGWHRGLIEGGGSVREHIAEHLEVARVVLLLLSADYVSSGLPYDVEMKRALERHADGSCRVIALLMRPLAGWRDISVDGKTKLGGLKPLPDDGRFVTDGGSRDAALAAIAAGVRRAIDALAPLP